MIRVMTTTSARPGWLLPAGLILFSLVPVLAGAARVGQLSTGAQITPDNARFFASPVPVVVHIVTVSVYALLSAFQFAPGLRRRRPGWHRAAGRLLVPSGMLAASAGLWMTLFYPHPPSTGWLLTVFRLVFGSAWILFLVLGFTAIRRWDVVRHRAWMMRAYAVGMGAGTQLFTLAPMLAFGSPDRLSVALGHLAGWVINVVVAEWLIRRPTRRAGVSGPLIPALETR
jgi:uncharacterized membrane protein